MILSHSMRGTWVALVGGLCVASTATSYAAISGINSPVTSSASIQFDDTTSFDPSANPGTTNTTVSTSPWNGTTLSLPFTTAAVTSDTAQGDIDATFAGNSYAINFNNVNLTQIPGNTGFAHLIFNFSVEYQLDAAGLPSQPTLFPNFTVNGTVQPAGFAVVGGVINYDGVNAAGTISTFETVTYGQIFNTPGAFSSVVTGFPTFGTTPALVGNTTMTLSGTINFMVDPASINAQSFMVAAVPEPASFLLALPSLALLIRRRSQV